MISFPNCKINIGLHVTEKRPDGFHNIETVMVAAGWQDILEIVPDEKPPGEIDFRSTGARVYGTKETNLCTKAYHLLSKNHVLPSVKIHLHKILPVGAGLGGGSADAVHTLFLLRKIFNLSIDDAKMMEYSIQLGSDCPFFLKSKPVYATGRGDEFESVKLKLKNISCIIVKPRIHVSTAQAYSWIRPHKKKSSLKELIQQPVSEWKNSIVNDFEEPVFEKYPAIRNIKNRLYKLGAVYASMSGSGSSVYGLFTEEKHVDTYFRSSTVWSGKIIG